MYIGIGISCYIRRSGTGRRYLPYPCGGIWTPVHCIRLCKVCSYCTYFMYLRMMMSYRNNKRTGWIYQLSLRFVVYPRSFLHFAWITNCTYIMDIMDRGRITTRSDPLQSTPPPVVTPASPSCYAEYIE